MDGLLCTVLMGIVSWCSLPVCHSHPLLIVVSLGQGLSYFVLDLGSIQPMGVLISDWGSLEIC